MHDQPPSPPAAQVLTGTHTTSGTTSAGFKFTAQKGHTYYIVVDGTAAAGADFTAKLIGLTTGDGCQ